MYVCIHVHSSLYLTCIWYFLKCLHIHYLFKSIQPGEPFIISRFAINYQEGKLTYAAREELGPLHFRSNSSNLSKELLLRLYSLNSKSGCLVLDRDRIFGTGSVPATLEHTVTAIISQPPSLLHFLMSVLFMISLMNLKNTQRRKRVG